VRSFSTTMGCCVEGSTMMPRIFISTSIRFLLASFF
jgi:hypothetical protein